MRPTTSSGRRPSSRGWAAAVRRRLRLHQLRRRLRRFVRRLHGRRWRPAAAARAPRGNDLRYNLTISLEEAFAGKQAQVRVPTSVACEACDGTGSEGKAEPAACPTCRGAGRVRSQQGFFTVERTCPTCHGSGRVVTNPCKSCSGSGLHAEGEDARRQRSGRGRGRHPHPALRRGRGRRARRPVGRSLHLRHRGTASAVPPRGPQHLLPGADPDDHGGARRRCRGADDRGQAGPPRSSLRAPRPASRSGSRARA